MQDVGRNKCHFSLAFCSVFVVVLSILVVNTLVQLGPLVFLSLAEKIEGQIDAIFSNANMPITGPYSYNYYNSNGQFLNYTLANELYGDQDNFAPRKQAWGCWFCNAENCTDYEGGRITLIETEREKQIELGTQYPFAPLKTGECNVPNDLKVTLPGLKEGSKLILDIKFPYTINTIAEDYNVIAKQNGWKRYLQNG